ncbi:MAG: isochorismatase family protein, partial [Actinomycetota bacterium]
GLQLGTSAVELLADLGPDERDHVVAKTHGLASFRTTGADATLRNLGVTTIVLTGVSMNVAIPSLAFEAVNLGYRVVIPRDAVAGVPPEFTDDVLDHSLSLVAEILTTDEILSVWR